MSSWWARIRNALYYAQYDQDEDLERLGVPFRILPGTDEQSYQAERVLVTRNIPIYTNKGSGELAQERRWRPSKLTSGKPLSQRT